MMVSVPERCLADQLAEEIGGARVVAALFSTFTFRREFFERVAQRQSLPSDDTLELASEG